MGKKKIYNLKEHERYEKRVDIFRTVQQTPQKTQQKNVFEVNSTAVAAAAVGGNRGSKILLMKKGANIISGFVNQSYLSSDVEVGSPRHQAPLGPPPPPPSQSQPSFAVEETRKGNPLYVSDDPVWMTRASFNALPFEEAKKPTEKTNMASPNGVVAEKKSGIPPIIPRYPSKAEFYPPLDNKPIKINQKKRRKQILITCLTVSLLLALVVAIVVLVVVYKLNSNTLSTEPSLKQQDKYLIISNTTQRPTQLYSNTCNPECDSNANLFCVHSIGGPNKSVSVAPSCACKPGYTFEPKTKRCEKSICHEHYYPYTFINNYANASQLALPFNTRFLRPYCCPHKTYLTSSCCGVSSSSPPQSSKRIIGGNLVADATFPWLVFVSQVYRPARPWSLMFVSNCSGSLVSDRIVLTAAHCLEVDTSLVKFNAEFPNLESLLRVYVGLRDLTKAWTNETIMNHQIKVRKILIHPQYNKSTFDHDLALIFLDRAVIRSDNIDYICLYGSGSATKETDSKINQMQMFTAGWGSTRASWHDLAFPDRLHYVDAYVYPMANCTYIFPGTHYSYLFDQETHICAGYLAETAESITKDTCYGDSGAPLMVQLNGQWFVYGILSYGSQPDCGKGPAMYTRISHYHDWIMQKIY